MKNLGALYRRQGKFEAAETLEEAAMRSRKQVRRLVRVGQCRFSLTVSVQTAQNQNNVSKQSKLFQICDNYYSEKTVESST